MSPRESIRTSELAYYAVFEPAEEGGYVVSFPAIPGLVTEGDTLDEARAMARDALRCFAEGQMADGLPLPPSDVPLAGSVREAVTLTLGAA